MKTTTPICRGGRYVGPCGHAAPNPRDPYDANDSYGHQHDRPKLLHDGSRSVREVTTSNHSLLSVSPAIGEEVGRKLIPSRYP